MVEASLQGRQRLPGWALALGPQGLCHGHGAGPWLSLWIHRASGCARLALRPFLSAFAFLFACAFLFALGFDQDAEPSAWALRHRWRQLPRDPAQSIAWQLWPSVNTKHARRQEHGALKLSPKASADMLSWPGVEQDDISMHALRKLCLEMGQAKARKFSRNASDAIGSPSSAPSAWAHTPGPGPRQE